MSLEIGDLVARIGLDSQPFARGINKANDVAKRGSTGISGAMNQMSRRSRNSLTQLAFAADDFIGVWQNSGSASAGIRAMSNNIGTLVTTLDKPWAPLAGIVTTVAFAVGSTLVNRFFDAGDAAEEFEKKLKDIEDRANSASGKVERLFRLESRERSVAEKFTSDNLDVASRERNDVLREIAKAQRLIDGFNAQLGGLRAEDSVDLSDEKRASIVEKEEKVLALRQEQLDVLHTEQRILGRIDRFQRNAIRDGAVVAMQIGQALMMSPFAGSAVDPKSIDERDREAEKKQDRAQREQDRAQREQEFAQREQERSAERFRGIELDLQSSLLTGEAKRRFDINRRFDEQGRSIFGAAPNISEALRLSGMNEEARQRELERGGPQGTQFAGVRTQGSAEAFSEILRAAGVAHDQKKEEKQTAKSAAEIALHTKAVADAMRTAQQIALIPDLGGVFN